MKKEKIPSPEKNVSRFAPLLVLAGAIFFSLGGILVKSVPWHPMSISSARCILAAIEMIVYMKLRKQKYVFNKSTVLGGFCLTMTGTLFVIANKLTTAANAILLQYTAPVFIIFLMWAFFHEKPDKVDVGATAVIFIGVVLFFLDSLSGGGGMMGTIGMILALLSGVSYAGVFMMKQFPGSDTLSSVLTGDFMGAIIGLPWLVRETEFTPQALTGVILVGAVQFGLGYLCMAEGLRGTPPLTASLISMVEPILNPVLAALVIRELPGPLSFVGAVIVIGGIAIYNVVKAKGEGKSER